jgi:hypothetical protein
LGGDGAARSAFARQSVNALVLALLGSGSSAAFVGGLA